MQISRYQKREGWFREDNDVEKRERSRCIDRRHKIHFMTWTLSSDWCISRRIASQIKLSSPLEPPWPPLHNPSVPSTLVCVRIYVCVYVGRFIGKNSLTRLLPCFLCLIRGTWILNPYASAISYTGRSRTSASATVEESPSDLCWWHSGDLEGI